jgi:hypothetical protein
MVREHAAARAELETIGRALVILGLVLIGLETVVLGYQSVLWLQDGFWTPIHVRHVREWTHLPAPAFTWSTIQRAAIAVEGASVALVITVIGILLCLGRLRLGARGETNQPKLLNTRPMIVLVSAVAVLLAWYENNLAAEYAAIGAGTALFMLHTIEVKLDKLLDHHGVFVAEHDIDRE